MDLRKIKKLIELLEDSALVEMEITEGENTIRLSRASAIATPIYHQPGNSAQSAPISSPDAPAAESGGQDGAMAVSTGNVVESPMVGTYYNSPSPDAAPFVRVGSKVKLGDTLCVIEAMKTFNQIEAESEGIIKAIHKSNGEPVEYGEPLFVID